MGCLFRFYFPVSRRDFSEANNNRNQQKTTKNPPLKAIASLSKTQKRKKKEKKSFTCVFFIIIATCLYFFTIFYFFFENISVIDNGPEKNECVNSNFVHYCTSMPPFLYNAPSALNPRSTVQAESLWLMVV